MVFFLFSTIVVKFTHNKTIFLLFDKQQCELNLQFNDNILMDTS